MKSLSNLALTFASVFGGVGESKIPTFSRNIRAASREAIDVAEASGVVTRQRRRRREIILAKHLRRESMKLNEVKKGMGGTAVLARSWRDYDFPATS